MTAWITTILIIITLLAILYTIFKKCRYVSSLPRVCFPLYPFSTILRGTARTDIFVEVVNLASAEAMWAHFASVAVHPSQLRITGYPRAYDMHIIKLCCCRQLQVDWQNIILWIRKETRAPTSIRNVVQPPWTGHFWIKEYGLVPVN